MPHLHAVLMAYHLPHNQWTYRPIGSNELGSVPSTHTEVSELNDYTINIETISIANEGSYCCMAYTDELNDTCGIELVCVEIEYVDGKIQIFDFEFLRVVVIVIGLIFFFTDDDQAFSKKISHGFKQVEMNL